MPLRARACSLLDHAPRQPPRAPLKRTGKLFTSARTFFDPIRATAQTFDRPGTGASVRDDRLRASVRVHIDATSVRDRVRGADPITGCIGTEPIVMSPWSRSRAAARALQSSRTANAVRVRPANGQKKTAAPGGRSSAAATISDRRFPAARRSRPDPTGR